MASFIGRYKNGISIMQHQLLNDYNDDCEQEHLFYTVEICTL